MNLVLPALLLVWSFSAVVLPSSALAAFGGPGGLQGGNLGMGEGPVEPSNEVAPVPVVDVAPTEAPTTFPALPPSLPCSAQTARGLWRLQHVYEEPAGYETSNFHITPIQYLHLRQNGTFGRLKGSTEGMKPKEIVDEIRAHTTTLLQYLVQDTGLIYFYQDKVANDTQSCFVVASSQGEFNEGDMLLMPPKGQIKGRLVQQYRKVGAKPKTDQDIRAPRRYAPPFPNYRSDGVNPLIPDERSNPVSPPADAGGDIQ